MRQETAQDPLVIKEILKTLHEEYNLEKEGRTEAIYNLLFSILGKNTVAEILKNSPTPIDKDQMVDLMLDKPKVIKEIQLYLEKNGLSDEQRKEILRNLRSFLEERVAEQMLKTGAITFFISIIAGIATRGEDGGDIRALINIFLITAFASFVSGAFNHLRIGPKSKKLGEFLRTHPSRQA